MIARAWGVMLLAFLLSLGLVSRRRALDDVFRWLLLLLTHYQVLVLLSAFPTGHTSTLGFVVGAVRGFAVPSPGYLVSCNSATETLVDAIALIAVTLLVGGLVAWRELCRLPGWKGRRDPESARESLLQPGGGSSTERHRQAALFALAFKLVSTALISRSLPFVDDRRHLIANMDEEYWTVWSLLSCLALGGIGLAAIAFVVVENDPGHIWSLLLFDDHSPRRAGFDRLCGVVYTRWELAVNFLLRKFLIRLVPLPHLSLRLSRADPNRPRRLRAFRNDVDLCVDSGPVWSWYSRRARWSGVDYGGREIRSRGAV